MIVRWKQQVQQAALCKAAAPASPWDPDRYANIELTIQSGAVSLCTLAGVRNLHLHVISREWWAGPPCHYDLIYPALRGFGQSYFEE